MQVRVTMDMSRLVARLDAFEQRQAPYAIARALTKTAQQARADIRGELPSIFDRPAPFTTNSLAVKAARKGEYKSSVFVKDLQAKYLLLEETGGERTPASNTRKPGATALVLPGKAMKLDRYGGIPRGALSAIKAAADQMRDARRASRAARLRHAAARGAKPGEKLPPAWPRDFGVFYDKNPVGRWAGGGAGYFIRREGHYLQRLTAFKKGTHYNPRLDFLTRAGKSAKASFEANWQEALREAMTTAK